MSLIFVLPIIVGILMAGLTFVLFKRGDIPPKFFAIALLLSLILVTSSPLYAVVATIRDLFGIVYSFVLVFGIAIVGIFAVLAYLFLLIGKLRNETNELWQEIALSRAEYNRHDDGED